jgi:glycosyltransferase involved in cell wall biosynthesis
MTVPDTASSCRLLVLQPALPRYRRPFFAMLGGRVKALTLVHGRAGLDGEVPPVSNCFGNATTIPVAHRRLGPVLWMPAMWRAASSREHDVAVFSWNSRYVHLPAAMLRARRAGMGVGLWGHGYSTRTESPLRRAVRNSLARLADAVITYNHSAARTLIGAGISEERVFVAPNALDGDVIDAAASRWRGRPDDLRRFRDALGIDGAPVSLHVSRLVNIANLRLLIDVWRLVVAEVPAARLLVVGDGPARGMLEAYIEASGLGASVRTVGAVYGEDAIAPYYLSARLALHPIKIGLSLNHAMGYGVPVATFDDPARHSPEFEALENAVNGIAATRGALGELAHHAAKVLVDDGLAARLGRGALDTMRAKYGLQHMADGFVAAIGHARRAATGRIRRTTRDGALPARVRQPTGR